MARGEVVGVAAFLEDGATVARLMHKKGDGEEPGDPVVFDADRGGWARPKPADEVTDADRRTYGARSLVPGELLDPQPPQEPVELPEDRVRAGVARKANVTALAEGRGAARAYLEQKVADGLIPHATAVEIAELVNVPAPRAKEG